MPAELEPQLPSDYEQSAHRLFGLLGQYPAAGITHYYAITWDAERPTRIDDIAVMTAEPTGARTHHLWGEFYRAQFRITGETASGESVERFIWCDTGPQRPGDPIGLIPEALTQEHGYTVINRDNIVQELVARADSVEDNIVLAKLMQQYGIDPSTDFASNIHTLIRRFAHGGVGSDRELGPASIPNQAQMFELLNMLKGMGSELPAAAQSYLISQLLRTISLRQGAVQAVPAADRAAATLGTAIADGVIPNVPRNTDRVLAFSPIYAYWFATDLLLNRLRSNSVSGTSLSILKIKRPEFVGHYVTTLIGASNPAIIPRLNELTSRHMYAPKDSNGLRQLYGLLNDLAKLVPNPQKTNIPDVKSIPDAVTAVAQLLPALRIVRDLDPDIQLSFDKKCVEVVRRILKPMIGAGIGGQALKP